MLTTGAEDRSEGSRTGLFTAASALDDDPALVGREIAGHALTACASRLGCGRERSVAAAFANSSYVAQRRDRKPSQNSDGMLLRRDHDRVVLSGKPKMVASFSGPTASTICL